MVVGIDDFRGHDPAHEEDGPWRRTIKSEVKTQMCLHVRGTFMCTETHEHTCPPVSNDEEEWVIGHDLRVQHQSPSQGDHS